MLKLFWYVGALALVALVALSPFQASSCISARTQQATLLPAARAAWPGVEADFIRGVESSVAAARLSAAAGEALRDAGREFESALESSNMAALRVAPWPTIERYAEAGIEDRLSVGEIGPGVMASLLERLSNFARTIYRLQGAE